MTTANDILTAPPPPSDGLALDYVLPELLIQDSVGRILCVVCNVYVPRGEMNASQHLSGKKHAGQARGVSHETIMSRRRGLLEHYAAERRNAPAASAEPGAVPLPSQLGSMAAGAGGDGHAAAAAVPELSERAKKLKALESLAIDCSGFLASVVGDSDSDSAPHSQDSLQDNGHLDMSGESADNAVAGAKGRDGAFTPMKYRAPADLPDVFFDSMAGEEVSTDKVDSIRKILSTKGSAETEAVTPQVITNLASADADENPAFLALHQPNVDDDNVKPPPKADPVASDVVNLDSDELSEGPESSDLPPWLIGEDAIEAVQYNPDSHIALHYEILEFERYMSPTKTEESTRLALVETVKSIVQMLWPESSVQVFGSYATNLFLPSSDIDICVMNSPKGGGESPTFHEHMELAQAIRNVRGMAKRVNFIKAKVPLVKIIARESNVQCDISFNRSNGPGNVPVIKNYIAMYPALRPLLMVLKCFLQQRSLNEVFSGGLGSYSVLLLVVSHLQMTQYNFPRSKPNLGSALMNFFKLYGRVFNYCLAGIQVKDEGSYMDKFEQYMTIAGDVPRFSIEDPNDSANELGRSSFAAARIRKAFTHGFTLIDKWRRTDVGGAATPLSTILHGDDSVLIDRRRAVVADFKSRQSLPLFDFLKTKLKNAKENGAAGLEDARRVAVKTEPFSANGPGYNNGFKPSGEPPSKRRRSANEFGTGFASTQVGFDQRAGGAGSSAAGPAGYGGEAFVPGGGMYDPTVQMAPQMQMDPFSGFAPDPTQLAQMQGLQYGVGMGGGAGGSWDGALQQQQALQQHALQQQLVYQRQLQGQQMQAYDPAYPQPQAVFGPGQSWRAQRGQRGGGMASAGVGGGGATRGRGGGRGGMRGGRGGANGNGRARGGGRGSRRR